MEGKPVYQDRIIVNPEILAGKPIIKGTRIPVDLILQRLSHDLDLQTLFEDYPRLTEEDIKACLGYARTLVEEDEPFTTLQPTQASL